MNILDLWREDINREPQSVSGGREYRGPCPRCSGDKPDSDRFGVWPQQNGGEGSFFCGREKGGGSSGCGKGGDIIAYLREFRNMSYKQACHFAGKEPKGGGGSRYYYTTPRMPKKQTRARFVPENKDYPPEVVNPELWREKGMKFVESCHQALLQRKMSIAYLMSRGISMQSIEKFKLGFHVGKVRGDKEYQMDFRPWPSWGLRDEKRPDGKGFRCIKLCAGLVIPYIRDGLLRSITIKLVKPGPSDPPYDYVKGSIREHYLIGRNKRGYAIVEGQFDAIAIDEAAGDLVGSAAVGTTGMRPDVVAAASYEKSVCILGALDNDPPRLNEKTGKIERPGAEGCRFWKNNYRQFRRWPVPEGKDPGEAFEKGVDLRLWIMAGLPPALLPDDIEEAAAREQSPLEELRDLLFESGGKVRIYDGGQSVGRDVPREWLQENVEKGRRISELLVDDQVIYWLENMADGIYDYTKVVI